jgi:uncharacterized Zn finger protein (UPF0148 family)
MTHPGADLPGRRCQGCGASMPSRMARTRLEDGRLVCPSCARNPQPGWAQPHAATLERPVTRVLAHDTSMVDAVARHCPFCGSGQTLGNSDGTISCGYCEQTYLVRLAPEFPAMPQVDPATGAPVGAGTPLDASGQPVPPGSPSGAPTGPSGPPSGPPAGPPGPTQQMGLAAHYRTRDGVLVGEDAYIEQLALRHAQDPAAVLAHVTALRMLDTAEGGRQAGVMSHTAASEHPKDFVVEFQHAGQSRPTRNAYENADVARQWARQAYEAGASLARVTRRDGAVIFDPHNDVDVHYTRWNDPDLPKE